ncbi:Periplasmic pH-dependent serine endoprotease DegQ precursor [Marinobacterium sp. xm-d-564]|nr:Do family serine endopeptidase [Marinobacterium sp. xm-d-564]NRP60481.1 Periplasmic pH-dependent serine endoprotease DegQ precursor [Marinobacterium sp. xm-d-564]
MRIAVVWFFSLLISSVSQAGLPVSDSQGQSLPSIAPMLERVNPAVVNISTFSTRQIVNPLLNDPFFQRFFNIPRDAFPQQRRSQNSAGSGVIVDAEQGTIITNYHVIKGADEVQIGLTDGRSFKARLIGADPEVDIAVLDIDATGLSELSIRDSSSLRVGDFVVAIGNPFGLGQTITTGVVSALGRSGLGIEGYENFIQTDASINPGNSGGALVDLNGDLVGINTAIIAPSGGNVGIGFAIPSNMARRVADQLIEEGRVTRGWAGLSVQPLTADLRQAFGLDDQQNGVIVSEVIKSSPADRAGLQVGDIITALDGRALISAATILNAVAFAGEGDKLKLELLRNAEPRSAKLIVAYQQPKSDPEQGALHPLLSGAVFEPVTSGRGVQVKGVEQGSRAARAGLVAGDLVVSINRRSVRSLEDLQRELSGSANQLLIQLQRGRSMFYLVLR